MATSPITVITTTASSSSHHSSAGNVSGPQMLTFKERTMSITSVTEEDDEPVSLLSERCRYISVSEEDENAIAEMVAETMVTSANAAAVTSAAATSSSLSMSLTMSATTAAPATTTTNQQTTVITEQPTATASKLELDLMLASADINTTLTDTITTTTQDNNENITTTTTQTNTTSSNIPHNPSALSSTTADVDASNSGYGDDVATPQIVVASTSSAASSSSATAAAAATPLFITPSSNEVADKSSPSIPTSIGTTTSEDSDEYRSLEPKDDTDFPISE
uniref:Alg9-like mannosyltransferase n=1 Tax=Musca domestica TaxID=7370 RepID=T1P9B2_MUSDO